ncbi:unnamed protein product [marine sediment metagenome]|uniref:Tyr recombinase domain-containing protein n=1 Tax=marine sediment metagenome TaxID=412755 RepID=X0Z644_9ZZZZ
MTQTIQTLTDDESVRLLDALKSTAAFGPKFRKGVRNYLIGLLMLDAGLRVGEVVTLRIDQLILLGAPAQGIQVITLKQKKTTTRTVPATVRLKEAIARMYNSHWRHKDPDLCPFAFGYGAPLKILTTRQVERIICTAGFKALRRQVHPHMLRHTFATRLMERAPIRVVQQLLGHAAISSTQIYQHPNSVDLKKAIDGLNGTDTKPANDPVGPA